jgi:hypothetical protein
MFVESERITHIEGDAADDDDDEFTEKVLYFVVKHIVAINFFLLYVKREREARETI